jgi:hypothetical protein
LKTQHVIVVNQIWKIIAQYYLACVIKHAFNNIYMHFIANNNIRKINKHEKIQIVVRDFLIYIYINKITKLGYF